MIRNLMLLLLSLALLAACGQSDEERQGQTARERERQAREDSAALKVGVMPTLDCLPMYVARMYGLYDSLGVDVRLRHFTAQMDCDTALQRGRIEGSVTDLVRAVRLGRLGTKLTCVTSTDAHWQLITNRNARITSLKHLDDKMLAMARFSATALLADRAVAAAGLKPERVFLVQVNDVGIRLRMLQNSSMDALLLTEPQATAARMGKNKVLMDSRKLDVCLGAVAFRADLLKDKERKRQIDLFLKAYDMACDSIMKNGVAAYGRLIADYCGVDLAVADSLPRGLKFAHAAAPRKKDIDLATSWLDRQ